MNARTPSEAALDETLSETTTKKRRMLLVSTMLTVFIVWCGVVPTRISALGVEMSLGNQRRMVWVLPVSFAISSFPS